MIEDPVRINQFLDVIFRYGPFWVYLALFTACFVENIFPPFPGDSFIVGAGALTAMGRLDAAMSLIVVIAGGMASVMVIYFFGRRYGREYFLKKDFKYLSATDIIKMEQQFARWGVVILVSSRFVVGMRSVLALVAGISRYDTAKMAVFSAVSYVLFAGILMYAAMVLVDNLELLKEYFRTYNLIVWPILIIVIGFYVIRKIQAVRRKDK